VPITQSLAALRLGDPVSRGPSESLRVWVSASTWERSVPSCQMLCRTGLSVGKLCAAAPAGASRAATTIHRMTDDRMVHSE
jgi:hypothetical protein